VEDVMGLRHWNYRIVHDPKYDKEHNGGEPWFFLAEVHYNNKGKPIGYSPEPCTGDDTAKGMRKVMKWINLARKKPVIHWDKRKKHMG
jgi:hypothetical protein